MRRFVLALLGTVMGATLLVGIKAQGVSDRTAQTVAAAGDARTGASTRSTNRPPTTRPGTTPSPTTRRPSTTKTPSKTTTKSPTKSPTKAQPATRTILGDAFPARNFGDVQVRITVTGTHLDDVQVVQMSNRPRNAPTLLRQQALSTQSADLSNVSGATYTSQAYMQSLQSALDKV
jgi:uncharacterized protein with FMN-binding domain